MVGASFSTLSPNRGMENSTGTSNLSLSFFFCFSLRSQSFSSDNFRTPIYKQICPPRWIIIFIEFFGFVSSSARRRCSRVHGRRRSDRRRTNRRKRRAPPPPPTTTTTARARRATRLCRPPGDGRAPPQRAHNIRDSQRTGELLIS